MLTPHNKVGIFAEGWSCQAPLIDLWEMLKTYAARLAEYSAWLAQIRTKLEANPNEDISPRGAGFYGKLGEETRDALRWLERQAKEIQLTETEHQIFRIWEAWDSAVYDFEAPQLAERLRVLQETLVSELQRRKLFFVNRPEFYEEPDLFGPKVALAFGRRTKEDIAEAGKCLAFERGTAAVFHCMRVAEVGLQTLAADMGVTLKNGRPLDYEDWQGILKAIDDKVKELRLDRTAENQESIQFYSEAAAQFRYFKDAWRNHVSHARKTYDPLQAESIFGHVREFMQDLATRIGSD